MGVNLFGTIAIGTTLALAIPVTATAQQTGSEHGQGSGQISGPGQGQGQGQGQNQGWRNRGGMGGGRGVLGSVTEVAADHFTIKTDSGETYTVHFSVNTRIMKQPAGRRQAGGDAESGERPAAQTLKPTDIKVGDFITAGGELDAATKSIGAVFIAQVDPERAKQMREMQANYGKTWLAGRITAIDGTTITIEGVMDQAAHSIVVDENTSFHQRRDAITLADIKPGEQLRAEGAMKGGAFLATSVTAMQPQNRGEGREQAPGSMPKPQ
jgi:preprotein translocase subunit YajC